MDKEELKTRAKQIVQDRQQMLYTESDVMSIVDQLINEIYGYIEGALDQKKTAIDKFTQWLWENAEITREEKNRDMLSKLLDSLKED